MVSKMYGSIIIFAYMSTSIVDAQHGCKPTDCYDLKCYMVSTGKDGPHTIYPSSNNIKATNVIVSCDQTTDGGGWIIYQRRLDGAVNFARTWSDYKIGFGKIGDDTDEMWMGHEKLLQIQQAYGRIELEFRIEATSFGGDSCWATCYPFKMRPETDSYSITWNTIKASHSDMIPFLHMHKGVNFSAPDRYTCDSLCLKMFTGAWWFHSRCAAVYLNGEYAPIQRYLPTSIFIKGFKDKESLQASCMMFRPVNETRVCNNPCKYGGTCRYLSTTNGYNCVCTSNYCGNNCEFVKPCRRATCVYDNATKTSRWDRDKCVTVLPGTTTAGATDLPATTTDGATDLPTTTTAGATDLSATTTDGVTDLPPTTTAGATDLPATTTDGATDLPATTTDGATEDTGPEKFGVVGLILLLVLILLLTAATVGFLIYRQKKTRAAEEAAVAEEAAERDRLLAEEEQIEGSGDGMFSFFGR